MYLLYLFYRARTHDVLFLQASFNRCAFSLAPFAHLPWLARRRPYGIQSLLCKRRNYVNFFHNSLSLWADACAHERTRQRRAATNGKVKSHDRMTAKRKVEHDDEQQWRRKQQDKQRSSRARSG
jgi:hypothetical protein